MLKLHEKHDVPCKSALAAITMTSDWRRKILSDLQCYNCRTAFLSGQMNMATLPPSVSDGGYSQKRGKCMHNAPSCHDKSIWAEDACMRSKCAVERLAFYLVQIASAHALTCLLSEYHEQDQLDCWRM